jgi:hypothetical protein
MGYGLVIGMELEELINTLIVIFNEEGDMPVDIKEHTYNRNVKISLYVDGNDKRVEL